MFLEQGIKPENKFWKYIVGSVVIIAASFIGQIPFMIAIAFKSFSSGKPFPTDEKSLLSFLNPNLSLFLLMLSFAFAFLAIYLVIKYLHKQTFLSVTDNGKGASQEQFKALYDEKEVVGIKSGLGLHLIRDLAKAIHCEITVDSKLGEGTTFTLKL